MKEKRVDRPPIFPLNEQLAKRWKCFFPGGMCWVSGIQVAVSGMCS